METSIYRISEIGEVIGGGTPSTEIPDYWDGAIPWISPKDLTGYNSTYISRGEKNITEKGLNKSGTKLLPQNTVLFTSRAPIGYVALAANPICTNQGFKNIICDESKVIPLFLYYYLKANLDYIKLFGTGATFPEISGSSMKKIKINIFSDTNYQRRIASILSAYDNLIENNNKRIRLLEQMAENLYKEWFVRFRFPGHEKVEMENGLPKGWKKGKLRDLAIEVDKAEKADNRNMYNHYLPIDKLPMKSMVLQEEDSVENAESSLIAFKRGDILFGAMRPYFHKVLLAPFDGLTRTTCFVVNAREPFYRLFLYMLMFQKSTVDYASTVAVGSTMPYDRWKDLSRMNIVTPDLATIERFNIIISPIVNRITENYEINQNLTRQRDLLLPRLMSGKLEVKE